MPETKEIELRSEEVQEILTKVPHWMIRWGNYVILLVLMLLFLMSYIVKYPDIVTTEILITTQTPPEKLVARSSGKIEKILVENRTQVNENTPLAIIENTADYQDVFQLKKVVDAVKLSNQDIYFPFEKLLGLNLGEIEASFAVFEKDYIAYELNKKLLPYQAEGIAQNFETIELQQRLKLLQQQKEISDKGLEYKKKDLERYKKLFEKGIIAAQEWEIKNVEYLQTEKEIKSMASSISQMKSSINDLNKNKKTTKINQNKDDISLYRNTIQSFNQLKKAISDWELAYVLRSSINGEVSFLQIWTENQTITSGESVFTIIPKNQENYIGKVKAKALNSGKIKEGQALNIRLSNYPDREFGVIKGVVKSISLTPDKDGNLLIDVALPNKLQTTYHKQIIFQQEMSGTADIITEDLRLIERLLYQFRNIWNQ